jgi:hypothetical protein
MSAPAHIDLLPLPGAEPIDTAYSDNPSRDKKIEMRILTPEECQKLVPVFERAGAVLPDPSTSFIVGILEDGEPTESFLVAQATLHIEPLHLLPKHRMYLKSMAHFMENEIVSRVGVINAFLFAPEGEVKQLAEVFGFTEEPWRVLSKRVGPTEVN